MTSSAFPRAGRLLLGVAVFAAALVLWELWARGQDSFSVPRASEVAERAWEDWPSSAFLGEVASSLERLAFGYVLGAALAIAVGLLMGSSRGTRRALEPFLELVRAVPVIALVPLLILILGYGNATRVAAIALGVFFPVLLNTIDGVRAIPPEVRDTASLLQVGRMERLLRVYLPAALPSIFAGLRVALSIGLVLVVISELAVAGDGIGDYIDLQQSLARVPEMYSAILFLGLLGWGLNQLFLVVERRVLFWHRGAVGRDAL